MPAEGSERDARAALLASVDREAYLAEHSGLPGPRANLTLAAVAADLAEEAEARRWSASHDEYLAVCGTMALARVGDDDALRRLANDPRWRVREAVVLGLQRYRPGEPAALLRLLDTWTAGTHLERRAAVATLAEPALLHDPLLAAGALRTLSAATAALLADDDRRVDAARTLRKTLGYAWSVVVAFGPPEARAAFEVLLGRDDPDLRWILRENLRKARMDKFDAAWAERCRQALER